ncbi:MAG: glycosyltransferase family 1 protein [Candidatus Andersenbacteria bacterium]|nr:glycosyltransferase family 1 protein [bacterium]MDZ4225810.1 glycosyltransferase family 1 protein [Candidatus Andersenbacteria bacterium]
MKISFDVSDLGTNRADGTTRYTTELARRLPLLGGEDGWVYHAASNFELGGELSRVTKSVTPWPKYWTQLRLPFDLYKYKPDVLFMPIQQLPYVRPRSMKTVAVIHDLAVHKYPEQFTYKNWALLHVFSAYVAREADEIIAVSQTTADDIASYYGRTKNVHVIYHGVDYDKFYVPDEYALEQSRKFLSANDASFNNPYLLYVGQMQPRKNLVRLVEAFEQLVEDLPDYNLVIAGGHGWLQKPILERIKNSQVRGRIILPGAVDDEMLRALYWNARVFVLPSLYEGFGLPVLEAFASGCPVVTANVSSLPEVAGDAAVLVEPKDVASIAAGIRQALENREELIRKGIVQAKKFTWDKCAQETGTVITK